MEAVYRSDWQLVLLLSLLPLFAGRFPLEPYVRVNVASLTIQNWEPTKIEYNISWLTVVPVFLQIDAPSRLVGTSSGSQLRQQRT